MNTSSLTYTSSPNTDTPSTLTLLLIVDKKNTHFPITEFQPTMVSLSHEFSLTTDFLSRTTFLRRTPYFKDRYIFIKPSSTTHSGPMTTLGPITQLL
jgi:hypothetical protein